MNDKDLQVIINRPVISQGDSSPFEVLNLSDKTMDAIERLVELDQKVEHQRSEIRGIHYRVEEADKREKAEYDRGFNDGVEEGKRAALVHQRAVNIAISAAYKEGVEDGKAIAKMEQSNEQQKEGK